MYHCRWASAALIFKNTCYFCSRCSIAILKIYWQQQAGTGIPAPLVPKPPGNRIKPRYHCDPPSHGPCSTDRARPCESRDAAQTAVSPKRADTESLRAGRTRRNDVKTTNPRVWENVVHGRTTPAAPRPALGPSCHRYLFQRSGRTGTMSISTDIIQLGLVPKTSNIALPSRKPI